MVLTCCYILDQQSTNAAAPISQNAATGNHHLKFNNLYFSTFYGNQVQAHRTLQQLGNLLTRILQQRHPQ